MPDEKKSKAAMKRARKKEEQQKAKEEQLNKQQEKVKAKQNQTVEQQAKEEISVMESTSPASAPEEGQQVHGVVEAKRAVPATVSEVKHPRADVKKFDGPDWVRNDVGKMAEDVICNMKKAHGKIPVTTTQLRKLLTAVNSINNKVLAFKIADPHAVELNDDVADAIKFLKVKAIYQAGRYPNTVKEFVINSHMLDIIDGIGTDIKEYDKFAKYMESLIAYHKYYGEED